MEKPEESNFGKNLDELALHVGGKVDGDGSLVVTGVAGIREAMPGQLSFVINEKYASMAGKSAASALIVDRTIEIEGFDLIRVDDPSQAWEKLLELIKPPPIRFDAGVHSSAVVSPDAVLGEGVVVMANVTIEPGCSIGDGTIIYPGVYVGHECRVGDSCIFNPNVVIRERARIGSRVIIHAGAVIGSDGFGFVGEDGTYQKQDQFGSVVLEDDVEIGANVTIDRARFDTTRIGRGTKIDNLVQIAHNVVTGKNCIIISQTGIAGSSTLGNNVILAGQVGVVGHLNIGDNVRVAAQSGIGKDVPENEIMFGSPAIRHSDKKRELISMRKIPDMLKTVKGLLKRVSSLETQSKND